MENVNDYQTIATNILIDKFDLNDIKYFPTIYNATTSPLNEEPLVFKEEIFYNMFSVHFY